MLFRGLAFFCLFVRCSRATYIPDHGERYIHGICMLPAPLCPLPRPVPRYDARRRNHKGRTKERTKETVTRPPLRSSSLSRLTPRVFLSRGRGQLPHICGGEEVNTDWLHLVSARRVPNRDLPLLVSFRTLPTGSSVGPSTWGIP